MRTVREIASEIESTWTNVNYAARPYLNAMHYMDNGTSFFGADRGSDVILYFLSNARTYRGDDAKRIKAELKAMVK
jgi:hypothetical protein